MKKKLLLLPALALGISSVAYSIGAAAPAPVASSDAAEWKVLSVNPAQGTIDLTANPGGVGLINIRVEGDVKKGNGDVKLLYNGEVISEVKAEDCDINSGKTSLYTTDPVIKNISIDFFNAGLDEELATAAGAYTVAIDEGAFKLDNTPLKALELEYVIEGEPVAAESLWDIIEDYYPHEGAYTVNEDEAGPNFCDFLFTLAADITEDTDLNIELCKEGEPVAALSCEDVWYDLYGEAIEDGAELYFDFEYAFEESGVYTIVIPTGFFSLYGKDLEGITLTYNVTVEETGTGELPEQTYITNPRFNTTLESLDRVVLAYDEYTVEEVLDGAKAEIYRNGELVEGVEVTIAKNRYSGVNIDIAPEITEKGSYSISINEGAFRLSCDVMEAEVISEAIIMGSFIVSSEDEIEFFVDPEDGAQVDGIYNYTFTFPTAETIEVNDELPIIVEGNGKSLRLDTFVMEDVQMIGLFFNGEDDDETYAIEEAGVYTLTVPEGAFIINDEPFQGTTVTVEVLAGLQEPIVDPVPNTIVNIEDLRTVTLTFADAEYVKVNTNMVKYVKLFNAQDEAIDAYDVAVSDTAENAIVLTAKNNLEDLTEAGEYYIMIPGNLVETNLGNNTRLYLFYEIKTSSVENMAVESEFDVYGINGLRLVKSGTATDVKTLPNGLYIINGKKVILRK